MAEIIEEQKRTANYLFYVFKQNPRLSEFDREYFIGMERGILGTPAHRIFVQNVENFLASGGHQEAQQPQQSQQSQQTHRSQYMQKKND